MKTLHKKLTHKIAIGLLFVLCVQLLGSCSKDLNQAGQVDPGTHITFSITGVMEEESIVPTPNSNNNGLQANGLIPNKGLTSNIISQERQDISGIDAMVTVEQGNYTAEAKTPSTLIPVKSQKKGSLKASTPLAAGKKFRIILYAAGTNTVFSTTVGTAGTQLAIPVEKGKSYDWAVFSYNDANDPGDATTSITTDQRDLLHASSAAAVAVGGVSGDGQDINVPVSVLLKHKLGKVTIEFSAEKFIGDISSITGALGANSYYQHGSLNLKTGVITASTASNTPVAIPFVNKVAGNNQVKVANYYTTGTTQIPSFQVTLSALTITNPAGNTTLPAAHTFNFPSMIPAAGKSITARIEFLAAAQFTCGVVNSFGTYTVETALVPATHYLETTVQVNKAGNIQLASEDKNGMKFQSTLTRYEPGAHTIRLLPVLSNTVINEANGIQKVITTNVTPNTLARPSKPNNAEEGTAANITAKVNNQTSSYIITNTVTNTTICNAAIIDVKPKVITMATAMTMNNFNGLSYSPSPTYWLGNSITNAYASDGTYASTIPKDLRIQMDMANIAGIHAGAAYYPSLWFVYAKNISGVAIPWTQMDASGSADYYNALNIDNTTHYKRTGDPIAIGARYGSMDTYGNAANPIPTASAATNGAHGAGNNSLLIGNILYAELTDVGFTIQIDGVYYKYRLMWDSRNPDGNNFNTRASLVLYGMHTSQPATYAPYTYYSANGGNTQVLPQRVPLVYNP